jgi:hypothetical protein
MTTFSGVRCGESGHSVRSSCVRSPNLTNTNPASEYLLDATGCLFSRRDLLFVVRSLRGAAGALLQGWSP